MIMGTSGVPRCAELLETTGVSRRAQASSSSRTAALGMSTAQKQKSTPSQTAAVSAASITTRFRAAWGMGSCMAQRPWTASW